MNINNVIQLIVKIVSDLTNLHALTYNIQYTLTYPQPNKERFQV